MTTLQHAAEHKPDDLIAVCACGRSEISQPGRPCCGKLWPITVRYGLLDRAYRGDYRAVRALIAAGVPFSLECDGCDAGDDQHSLDQALAAGWTRVQRDDGLGWNFLGLCPDCRREGNC